MSRDHSCIMALVAVSRGLALAVIDHAGNPIEWRLREIHEPARHKNARCIFEADRLIEAYRPQVLVLEDPHAQGATKRKRTTTLFDSLTELAREAGVDVAAYGPREVRATFGLAPGANKDALAAAVATRLPSLKRRLPKPRRLWESEHYAIPIFVALALALTHLGRAQR